MRTRNTILSCFFLLCALLFVLSACNRGESGSGTIAVSNSNSDSGGGTTAHSSPNNPGTTAQSGKAVGPSMGPETVTITLNEYTIQSSEHNFHPGQAYRFQIKNVGQVAHEFMIMPKAMGTMSGMGMGDMDKRALAASGTLTAGQSKTLDYAFTQAAAHSHPQFACYTSDHYQRGMKLDVAVN